MFIGNHSNRIHCCLPGYELCIFTVPRYQHFYRRACGHQVGICQSPAPFVTRIHGIVICRHKCQSCSGSGPLVLLAWHDYWKLLIYMTSIFSFASWGWSSSPSCTNLSRMVWPWCQPRWECVKDIGLIFKKIRMKSHEITNWNTSCEPRFDKRFHRLRLCFCFTWPIFEGRRPSRDT